MSGSVGTGRLMKFFEHSSHIWLMIQCGIALFQGVLFTQSAVDKITDFSGNVGWLTGHFEDTIFARFVPALVGAITVMEAVTGLASFAAVVALIMGVKWVAVVAALLCCITLLQLFLGQRIAKDYPGAAVLVPYFTLAILWLATLTQG